MKHQTFKPGDEVEYCGMDATVVQDLGGDQMYVLCEGAKFMSEAPKQEVCPYCECPITMLKGLELPPLAEIFPAYRGMETTLYTDCVAAKDYEETRSQLKEAIRRATEAEEDRDALVTLCRRAVETGEKLADQKLALINEVAELQEQLDAKE